MQAAGPCGQEELLKDVLWKLGFKEYQLKDLHNVVSRRKKAVKWRLVSRVANLSIVFAVIFWGVAVAHFWEKGRIFETQQNLR